MKKKKKYWFIIVATDRFSVRNLPLPKNKDGRVGRPKHFSKYFKHQEALALLEATFPYNHPKCVSKHVKIESDTELQHNLSCQQLFTKIHRVVLAFISLKVNSKIIYMCKHGPWDNSAQVPVSRKALYLFGPGGKFSKILKSKPVE